MQSGFDTAWLETLSGHIAEMERSFIEGLSPGEVDLADIFADPNQVFFSIDGLADFWSNRPGVDFAQHIADIVVGAHNQHQADLTLVLMGSPRKLSVYISLGSALTTRTILEAILPGIRLNSTPATELASHLRLHFMAHGVLTGVPSHKTTASEGAQQDNNEQQQQQMPTGGSNNAPSASQLERVIRGMEGTTWSYIVQAHPRPRSVVTRLRLDAVDLLAQVTSRSRLQMQITQQDSRQLTTIESGSRSQTSSSELVNYRAQYLIKLLERELQRLDRAIAEGQWTVMTYFGANALDDAHRLASLLVSAMTGKQSRPAPIRAALCQRRGASLSVFNTFLSSDELATLIQLPREEVPGYAIHDFVRFDVDFRASKDAALALGHIQQNGRDVGDTYNIALNALAKHGVVVGVTGSGKTTTVMNLVDRMVEAKKPFLVIEPAKTEYRALHTALAGRAELHVYALGNENLAPFRLNPFEFETDDEPGSASVLTHIDFLKAVFNAAFVLYAPMPHVLETALHEVYEDRGWDVATGLNRRLLKWDTRHLYPIFPTLSDLYRKIDVVTNRLGYHDEVERNVKAGLKARIGSLRLGSKGLMLDTARGIPMQYLLSSPTILEMEGIGSDEEKTFMMGLFLAKLYEYRRLQAASGTLPAGLQHLLVFEEAHRLLKNTSTQVDSESSNMRSQAIEVFTNMLSEVRAYGQGVLVAEQIPSKLAPDVLKNTNLKIAHRLIAQDDRQSVGQTMNLNQSQTTHLGILAPGMAAIYAEGADHAYLVRMENYKRNLSPLKDAQLKQISPAYASVAACQAIVDIKQYGIRLTPFGSPNVSAYQAADRLLETEKSTWLWSNILLRAISNPSRLLGMVRRLSEHIEAEMSHLQPQQHEELLRMLIVRGCAEVLSLRGAQFGWTFPQVEEMRHALTLTLLTLNYYGDLAHASTELEHFVKMYKDRMQRKQGPFAGCTYCPTKCMYRSDVQHLLSPKDVERVDRELTSDDYATSDERYSAVAHAVTSIAERWLGGQEGNASVVGYCAAMHAITKSDFTEYEQALVGDNLQFHLLQ